MRTAATDGNISTKHCTEISVLIISLPSRYQNIVQMRNHSLKKLSDLFCELEEPIPDSICIQCMSSHPPSPMSSKPYLITTSSVKGIFNLLTYYKVSLIFTLAVDKHNALFLFSKFLKFCMYIY